MPLIQQFTLPYPPTVNTYWRWMKRGMVISEKGRAYRKEVWGLLKAQGVTKLHGRVDLLIYLVTPDRRQRDLDNVLKALIDALEHGGAFGNDDQIDRITITRCGMFPPGSATVLLTEAYPG